MHGGKAQDTEKNNREKQRAHRGDAEAFKYHKDL
jgi:hypothetical protein